MVGLCPYFTSLLWGTYFIQGVLECVLSCTMKQLAICLKSVECRVLISRASWNFKNLIWKRGERAWVSIYVNGWTLCSPALIENLKAYFFPPGVFLRKKLLGFLRNLLTSLLYKNNKLEFKVVWDWKMQVQLFIFGFSSI